MSSSLAKSETSKPPAERRKPYAPKRFIFNVPETTLKKADSEDNIDLVSTSEDHVYIPLDFAFPSPNNYQDAYNSVCEHITNIFNEIHKHLFADYNEIIQETIEAQNIQGPKDCLNFIKSTAVKLADNIQKSGRKGGINKEAKEYERLLQKSEAKVRDLIRNEQIYRISFDQYTIRHEETERVLIEFQYKLKDKRAKIEALTQENQKLSSLIQSKEEEIRSLISENQNPLSNPGLLTPHSESPLSPDHQTAKLKNLNLQNLKGLLSTSKGTPIDNVALTPESGGLNNPTKLSARVSSPASAMKTKSSLDRYGKSRSTATGPLTLKINTLDKPKEREGNKNRLEILTDRKRLDNSAEQKMNSSERNLDSFNFNLRAVPRKAPSTQLSLAEQPKKPNPRKLVRHETSVEDKSKMINSTRLRPYDDSAAALFKVEASEDYEPYSAVLGRTAQKRRDEQRQIQSKREEYQLLNSSRQRVSGASKMRPVMADLEGDSEEKSPKLKHIMTRERQPAYGFSNKQNSSKERSPRPDASGSKTPQSNTVFVNIMLKKLNSQKVTTKKGLL